MSLVALLASCVWVPRDHGGGYHDQYQEGYYDRDHNRYYHDHAWHPCQGGDDPHCH